MSHRAISCWVVIETLFHQTWKLDWEFGKTLHLLKYTSTKWRPFSNRVWASFFAYSLACSLVRSPFICRSVCLSVFLSKSLAKSNATVWPRWRRQRTRRCSARLGSTQLGSVQFYSTRLDSTQPSLAFYIRWLPLATTTARHTHTLTRYRQLGQHIFEGK